MEVKRKRERGANFNDREVDLLMQCIFKEIEVIENKKTDMICIQDKKKAWERVYQQFNSQCPGMVPRDISSIKLKYENVKRLLKKKMAKVRQAQMQTGGGPPTDLKLCWYEEFIYSKLQMSIIGLPSYGDCDEQTEAQPQVVIDLEQREDSPQGYMYVPPQDPSSVQPLSIESEMEESPSFMFVPGQAPSTSQMPPIEQISLSANNAPQTSNQSNFAPSTSTQALPSLNQTPQVSRPLIRRPRTTIAKKVNAIESVKTLADTKKELTLLQIECYKKELELKQKELLFKDQENTLKLQILQEQLQREKMMTKLENSTKESKH